MIKRLWVVLLVFPFILNAQSWKSRPFSVSMFNNATLLPPASVFAVFNQPVHPGIAFSYEFGWRETTRSPMFRNINTFALGGQKVYTGKWFQNISLSWFYHRYVNHAVLLTTQAGYRRYIKKFSAEASLHAGYMHAFQLTERAVRKADGSWKSEKGYGRPQFVTGAGIGIGYDAGYHYNIRRVFINYDFRLQMPFVKSYVPLLPNGILSLGLQFTLFKNVNKQNNPVPGRLECPRS
ncbi:MAG: hypothetical protein V1775_06295 [Bacteroidota bacterium]